MDSEFAAIELQLARNDRWTKGPTVYITPAAARVIEVVR
jgi:hypothetical protein